MFNKHNTYMDKFIAIEEKDFDIRSKKIKFQELIKKVPNFKIFKKNLKVKKIEEASHIKILDIEKKKKRVLELKKDFFYFGDNTEKEIIFFKFNDITYFFDSNKIIFKKLKLDSDILLKDFIENHKNGLDKNQFNKRINILGENKIFYKKRNYLYYLFEEIFNYVGWIELICIVVYFLENLYGTAIVLLVYFVREIQHVIKEQLRKNKSILDFINNEGNVIVYRKNKMGKFNKLIDHKKNLVFGDLIEILEKTEIPADCVLIQGSVTINDSFTKGIKNYVNKKSIKNYDITIKEIPKENILLQGRKCVSSINHLNYNNLALVLRTGNLTFKGKVIENLLYKGNKNHLWINQLKKILLIIFVMSLFLLIIFNIAEIIMFKKKEEELDLVEEILQNLELFFCLLKPQIPILFLNALKFYSNFLKRKNIEVINSNKIFDFFSIKYWVFDPIINYKEDNYEKINKNMKIYNKDFKLISKEDLDSEMLKAFFIFSNSFNYNKDTIKTILKSLTDYNFETKIKKNKSLNLFFKNDTSYESIIYSNFKENENIEYCIIKDLNNNEHYIYISGYSDYFLNLIPNFFKEKKLIYHILFFKKKLENYENNFNFDLDELFCEIEYIGSIHIPHYFIKLGRIFNEIKHYDISIKLLSKKSLNFNLRYAFKYKLINSNEIWDLDYSYIKNQIYLNIINIEKKNFSIKEKFKFSNLNQFNDKIKEIEVTKLCISKNFINFLIEILKSLKDKKHENIYKIIQNNSFILYNLDMISKKKVISLLKHNHQKKNFCFIGNDSTDLYAIKNSNIGISLDNKYCSIFSNFKLNGNFNNILKLIRVSKICLINTKISLFYTLFYCFFMFVGLSYIYVQDYELSNVALVYFDLIVYLYISSEIIKIIPKNHIIKGTFDLKMLNKKYSILLIVNIILSILFLLFVLIFLDDYLDINEENVNFIVFVPISIISLILIFSINWNKKSKKEFKFLNIFFVLLVFNFIIFFLISSLNLSESINESTKFIPNNENKKNFNYYLLIIIGFGIILFCINIFILKRYKIFH